MGVPVALLPHSVTRVRPADTTDGYNNTVRDYGVAATRTAADVWLQQDDRSEPRAEGRDADVQTWLLIANDSDWVAFDRVEWSGPVGDILFEVDGPPEPVYTPAGLHHIEATLRVVTG